LAYPLVLAPFPFCAHITRTQGRPPRLACRSTASCTYMRMHVLASCFTCFSPYTRVPCTLLQNRPLFLAICPGSLWARDNRWLLSRVQRLAGPAGGTGAFCPGWRHQPGQNGSLLSRLVVPTGTKCPRSLLSRLEPPTGTKVPPFVPVRASNRDKRPCAPYPLPSPPARAIQLTCFLCSWLGIEEFLLISSPHL